MKKLYMTILALLVLAVQPALATSGISLKFNRTGTDASSVTVNVTDENGTPIEGATATVSTSHDFKATSNAVTGSILCPNINANTNPNIELNFTIEGVPAGFSFNNVGLDIHALNGGSNYQENADNVTRQWNVGAVVDGSGFGSLDDIDIAAGVGTRGNVHKVWNITSATALECDGTVAVTLTITKGTTNGGCFIGISEVILGTASSDPEPDPEPEPEPEPTPDGDYKVYYIKWKNTGTNYISEEADHRMTVQGNDVKLAQFWMFIPTGNENCYYIKNTATGRYMGSCNLTPSSSSKIYTSTTPVEYYVGKTKATSGEIADCWYFSSTDCENYDKENLGPRALNKDGASNYVITWQAGTTRPGSYWQLEETPDLYEIQAFEGSSEIGRIGTSYHVEALSGKNLTIADGALALAEADDFDENQEWYFVGTTNREGWLIASAAEPATVIGISDNKVALGKGLGTKWKTNASKQHKGYFHFTSEGRTLVIDGDSLFCFKRLRSAYARKLQVYNNPCGRAGTNYVKSMMLHGEAAYSNIIYEAKSKPSTWHVVYANDKGEVAKNSSFDIDVILSATAASDLVVKAYFDWNGDGIFETDVPVTMDATRGNAKVAVPEWATTKQTRMRLRVNNNGLELAEDEVSGFIYDFHIKVVEPQEGRTATVAVNSPERGEAVIAGAAASYAYGTQLTAKATAYGNAQFVCWREEGVVVSTSPEYTFTVDRNVKLVAYFSPNTDESSYPAGIEDTACDENITIAQSGNYIVAYGPSVTGMTLYTVDAAAVAASADCRLDVAGIKEGVYIVRVTTAGGYKNVKVFIKK